MGISIAKHKRALASAAMAVVLVAGLAVPTTVALAEPTAAEKQAEAQQALNKLNEMQQKLDEASNNYYTAIDEQKAAEKKVEEAQEKVDQKTREIEGYQEKLGTRARDMYRSGNTGFLDVILGASSFEQFATTWNTLERLNENDAELVTETKNAREELENAKQEAEAQELMRKEEEAAEKARQEAAAREAAAAAAASKNNGGGTVDNSAVQTVTGNTVVDRAYAQLGKPYVWGTAGPNSFDCSGLVGYCITGKMGNHWCTTYTMASWKHVTNPQPGDFCLNSHHTGVYIGNGQMIHAPRTGDVVKISAVHSGMWYVRY